MCATVAGRSFLSHDDNDDDTARTLEALPAASYDEKMNTSVRPFCANTARQQSFQGVDQKTIKYTVYPAANERGALVFLPGRTEPVAKYCELFYDLRDLGLSVYAMDLRGQGESDRLLPDRQKGHVERFDDYVTDLDTLVTTVITPATQGKLFFLGHSTGGTIGALYMERNPYVFEAGVLSSPLLELRTSPFPESVAYAVTALLSAVGKGADYSPGRGPFDPNERGEIFQTNAVTHSPERFAAFRRFRTVDRPEIVIGGPTNAWVSSTILATWNAKSNAQNLRTPLLVFQSSKDKLVVADGQNELCDKAKACTLKVFPNAYHEILNEADAVRDEAIAAVRSFVEAHVGKSPPAGSDTNRSQGALQP